MTYNLTARLGASRRRGGTKPVDRVKDPVITIEKVLLTSIKSTETGEDVSNVIAWAS